jgi:hypothetical protein
MPGATIISRRAAAVNVLEYWVVADYEFLMTSSLVEGVILSAAVLQAERRISRYDTVCTGRSLGPLVKTRALRDDAL